MAGGDARRALTYLEAAALGLQDGAEIDLAALERAVDRAAVRYDRAGDQHYDVISAFIKSIRGSDADAALHYLARMIEAGEDPRFIARRLIVHASEDVGMADPSALPVAVAAAQAVEFVGLPEARINLAQAVIHLSLAPKSNAVIAGHRRGPERRAGRADPGRCPRTCATAATAARPGSGTDAGTSTRTTSPRAWWPRPTRRTRSPGRRYYEPTRHGAEARYAERSERIREILGLRREPQEAGIASRSGQPPSRGQDGPAPNCEPRPVTAGMRDAQRRASRPPGGWSAAAAGQARPSTGCRRRTAPTWGVPAAVSRRRCAAAQRRR